MASFQQRRCQHCLTRYSYQASGYGCHEQTNSGQWCPVCAEVVYTALKAIPQRVATEWVVTTEPSCQELVALEKERATAAREAGQVFARRVLAPLFDMTGERGTQHQGILTRVPGYANTTFRYEWWEKKGVEAGVAYVKMEINLVSNESQPWQEFPTR